VYERERLRAGHRLRGPAIVEQFDTTVVIDQGATAEVDHHESLAIEVGAS
jgi:N-methylhydantoinase A